MQEYPFRCQQEAGQPVLCHPLWDCIYLQNPSLKRHQEEIGGEVDPCIVDVFDSSTISLFKEILKGAGRNSGIDGKKKGGIKAFTKMNLAEGVPDFICLKAASTNRNTILESTAPARRRYRRF
ncbi:MAG: hypothetical protein U5K79_06240 [Cyclobacteriaceae bacterium]|nr:hypothetical protein [Cyclobacteriaceae bacterium]